MSNMEGTLCYCTSPEPAGDWFPLIGFSTTVFNDQCCYDDNKAPVG